MRGPEAIKTTRARSLRQSDNDAEAALWAELRDRRLNGHKFVRQLDIGIYFADFACRESKLVVEVDGSQHAGNSRDRLRDRFMVSEGWSVLRFWNIDVLRQREAVLETILAALEFRLDCEIVAPDLRFVASREYREKTR
jgi:very-short-patch-repair endonuclease